ncbi:hypothetical protein N836_16045 [Leptolyngbya sp. Heron Island J]|uniref:hypothetical protein n=1 Tax=Leptolyngbya sp. Heron Island J TaxID=1385935 RepID=UPI0003B97896|nr:hypothetical protein [Leptolyngbya sp. Heron Island J]ESA34616.1 hypothetical protein N836_16045 [Leptolyngbya sp. Heron Island J]
MSHFLSSEDLPPATITDLDAELKRQLEGSICQHFFEACDGSTQSLLMACRWTVKMADVVTLHIYCSDQEKNWRVLNRMAILAEYLSQFSSQAKIRVHPPSDMETPFDMRVDERSV